MVKSAEFNFETGETTEKEGPALEPVAVQTTPISTLKRMAYEKEADPLYFKWQRGEATEQDWLDKVQEIRERYAVES